MRRRGKKKFCSVVVGIATMAVSLVAVTASPAAADRGGLEEIISLEGSEGVALLSGDLSTLLVNNWEKGETSTIALDTGVRSVLALPGSRSSFPLALSEDGSVVAINGPWEADEGGDSDGRLNDGFLYDVATGNLELVTPGPTDVVNEIVTMSADGTAFVLMSHALFDGLYPSFSLMKDGVQTSLDLGDGIGMYDAGMMLSADASTLLYTRQRGQSMVFYALDLVTDEVRTRASVNGGYGVGISADGTTVAWIEEGGEFSESGLTSSTVAVWQAETDAFDLYELDDMSSGLAAVSADGSTVSGFSHDYGDENEFQPSTRLWQLDVGNGEVETLVSNMSFDGGSYLLGANADGSELVFAANGIGLALDVLPTEPYEYNTVIYRWSADGTPSSAGAPVSASLADQIVRLYQAYFGRVPDQGGLDHWTGARASGTSLSEVSSAFAGSPEFQETYGSLDDAEFVALVYQNVLGRAPDAGGLAYWTGQLAIGVSRGQVMVGFSESAEFVAATGSVAPMSATEGAIVRMYLGFFGREPSAGEISSWTNEINGGRTLGEIADVFGQTDEYRGIYGQADLYVVWEFTIRRLLGRHPIESDYLRWLEPMEQGQLTVPQFILGVANEPEFVLATGTTPLGG